MKILFFIILFLFTSTSWARFNACGDAIVGKSLQKWKQARAFGLNPAEAKDFTVTRIPYRDDFQYFNRNGQQITNPATIERLTELKIRKDLTDVRISTDPLSHIQAIGVDAAGRTQRVYHPLWNQARDLVKFNRMLEFGSALPKIRARAEADFKTTGLTKTRLLAAIVILLDITHIRIGNQDSADDEESYGLTTMEKSHVRLYGKRVRFDFIGKSSREHQVDVEDAKLADLITELRKVPGDPIFQYVSDSGKVFPIRANDVNRYLASASGQDFTAKEFRTWGATVTAVEYLTSVERPTTEAEMKTVIRDASMAAAEDLGNTWQLCKQKYIHPVVFAAFQDSTRWKKAFSDRRVGSSGLSNAERAVLKLLKGN